MHQCAKGCTDVATGTWQAQYQVPRLQRSVCIMLSSTIHLAGNKTWYFYVEVLRNKIIHGTARHTHLCSSVNFQNSQRQCTKHALELKQLGLFITAAIV